MWKAVFLSAAISWTVAEAVANENSFESVEMIMPADVAPEPVEVSRPAVLVQRPAGLDVGVNTFIRDQPLVRPVRGGCGPRDRR